MTSSSPDSVPVDPVTSNPEFYRVLWENDDVRVLEYRDRPGQQTTPHTHPNSVLIALTDFHRRLMMGDQERDVVMSVGSAQWLPAQSHSGRNTGTTPTWTILVEMKNSMVPAEGNTAVGPTVPLSPGTGP